VVCCRYVELPTLGVLQIENVANADQGTYRCVATNDARERRSNDAQLVVVASSDNTGQLRFRLSNMSNTHTHAHIHAHTLLTAQFPAGPVISRYENVSPFCSAAADDEGGVSSLALGFNGHFPGEPGLAGVY